MALIREVMQLRPKLLMKVEMNGAPWQDIFMVLCGPYLGKSSINEYTEDEMETARDICKAVSMISSGIPHHVISKFLYSLNTGDPFTRVILYLAQYRHSGRVHPYLLWAMENACTSLSTIASIYFHHILLHMQQIWPNWSHNHHKILSNLAEACNVPFDIFNQRPTIPVIDIDSFDVLFDLVARQDGMISGSSDDDERTPLMDRYVVVVRWMKNKNEELGGKIHRSIQRQLLAHIANVGFSSPSASSNMPFLLNSLQGITNCEPLALYGEERDMFIQILTMLHLENLDSPVNDKIEEALLIGLKYSHLNENLTPNRSIGLITVFDAYFESKIAQYGQNYSNASRFIGSLLQGDPSIVYDSPKEVITRIRDPCLALWLRRWSPDDWQFETLSHPDFSRWNDMTEDTLFGIWNLQGYLIRTDTDLVLLRAIIVDGPPSARGMAINHIGSHLNTFSTTEPQELLRVFSSPVLYRILDHSILWNEQKIKHILTDIYRLPWFYEQFGLANGLIWLSRFGLGVHWMRDVILGLLTDHIVFESVALDINGPLECAYICLQTLRGATQPPMNKDDQRHFNLDVSEETELLYLRDALLWVMNCSIKAREGDLLTVSNEIPQFASMAIRNIEEEVVAVPRQVRSFEFARGMSEEEWAQWIVRLKTMIMGVALGGLGPGRTHDACLAMLR
ncbi:hypothetical protein CPB86DRAFT_809939 [Serendipita vermifera]|nr:hypothetical protein CPB86DRAFT_809939 [Serendipita vermifera]